MEVFLVNSSFYNLNFFEFSTILKFNETYYKN